MPSKTAPTKTATPAPSETATPKLTLPPAGQLAERRVRHIGAGFFAHATDENGQVKLVQQHARRGEAISLTPVEEARLDALGALAPAGASADDIKREIEQTLAAYQAARSNVGGVAPGGGI
jgi:hypothetical protein